jgi:hypothetical protein
MSSTRFYDDEARVQKQIEESSFTGRYMLNTPGPGSQTPFFEDCHVRLQKWGANLHNNTVNLESDLKGLGRNLNRDNVDLNNYEDHKAVTYTRSYTTEQPFVEETRYTHPAWIYVDKQQNRWEKPFVNPQSFLNKDIQINSNSRNLVKDTYTGK